MSSLDAIQAATPESVPTIGFILIIISGLFSVAGAALLAGWRIVSALEKRLAEYVRKDVADEQRKALMDLITHMHGCLHEMKRDITAIRDRNRRKDRADGDE